MKSPTAYERAMETIARFEKEIGETIPVSGHAFTDAVFRSFTHFADKDSYVIVQRQKSPIQDISILGDETGDVCAATGTSAWDQTLATNKFAVVSGNDGSLVNKKFRTWMLVPVSAKKETFLAIVIARGKGHFHSKELKAAEHLGAYFTQSLHAIRSRNKKHKVLSDDIRHRLLLRTQSTLGRDQPQWDGYSALIDYGACVGSDIAGSYRCGDDSLLLYAADVTADDAERQAGLIYLDTWFSILSRTSLDARGMLQRLNADMVRRKAECYASVALIRYMAKQETAELAGCGNVGMVSFTHETMKAAVFDFGPACGIMDETEMKTRVLPVRCGDILCAFTDGISGMRKRNGDLMGAEAIAEIIRKNYFLSSGELAKKILAAVMDREEKDINADDRTLQVLKIE